MLKDPFSDETRRRRRSLLVSSSIAILMSAAGWLPEQISALGLTFGSRDQQTIIWLTFGIVVYFLFTFVTDSWADLLLSEAAIEAS